MTEKQSQLKPGDQVCCINDIYHPGDEYEPGYIEVPKGAFGTVISFEEYWIAFRKHYWFAQRTRDLETELKDMEDWGVAVYWGEKDEKIIPNGNTVIVDEHHLATLDFLDQTTVFVLGQIRVIYTEGDNAASPEWGYKALCVDFLLQDWNTKNPCVVSSLEIWLTYINPGCTSQDTIRTEPFRVDLLDRDSAGKSEHFRQAIFHVPGNTGTYSFHLEFRNVGTVEKIIKLSSLQPGDRVHLKRNTNIVVADDGRFDLQAAEGSIGTIATFSQYREYLRRIKNYMQIDRPIHEDVIKKRLEICNWEGCWHPVRFEKVNHSSDAHSVHEGEIVVLSASDLEKLE